MTLYLNNISYIAVPKNGTISIKQSFKNYAINFELHKHESINQVKNKSDNPCIATIRNPVDWIISYYKYLKYSEWFINSHWGIKSKSFNEFILAYINGQHLWPEPFRKQSDYINGNSNVEYLYRYEDIEKVFIHLENSIDKKVERLWENRGIKTDIFFDPKLKNKFMDYMKKDFEIYESI